MPRLCSHSSRTLSGEICPTCGQDRHGSRTEAQGQSPGHKPPDPKVILAAPLRAIPEASGQKSAEAIVAQRLK